MSFPSDSVEELVWCIIVCLAIGLIASFICIGILPNIIYWLSFMIRGY